MLRESSRQKAISLDSDDDMVPPSPAVRKVDFSKPSRKKVQTPKKKAVFTPLRRVLDIKPKIEPDSPTPPTISEPGPMSGREDVKPTIVQESVDVKPDVNGLQDLLGGLAIDSSRAPKSPRRNLAVKVKAEPWTPATRKPVATPSTPLFLPHDTPVTPAPRGMVASGEDSFSESPLHAPPDHFREVSVAITPGPSAFDLFSDDSPPPKRGTLSPVPSPSRSSARAQSSSPAVSDHSSHSQSSRQTASPEHRLHAPITSIPVAGPSQIKTPARRRAFLDFLAKVDGEESEDEEAYGDDLSGSMGSLRDFIVDDDEVDYQSGDSQNDVDSDIEPYVSDDVRASHIPRFELDSDGDICETTSHGPKIERGETDSDSDIEIVEDEAISRPKAKTHTKSSLLDEFIDSDNDDDILETSEVDDALSSAIDNLNLESKGSRSKSNSKKTVKGPKWALDRIRIAQEVFDDLDKRVFEGRLGKDGAGAEIVWNKRLLTTAGTAHRKKRRHLDGTTTWDVGIQLSDKVCTGEEQILSTVAHEMCHLACWVISNEFKNPHGKIFKSWGRKVMRKRDDLEVTTRHDYIIEYKYKWRCVGCQKVYKRHSKSIDIEKQGCGICKGKLEPMFETKQRASNTFQLYLKDNMATAKAALPGASHGEVMRALSARWSEAGPEADHQAHWKTVLAASRS